MTVEQTTTRPRIVLDCDPGLDDMFAIFCALRYCELVAVTSVAGNVGIDHTTRNALAILELAGAGHIPVHRGARGPLDGRTLEDARHVHGDTGLGGVSLPAPTAAEAPTDAVEALLSLTQPGDVAIVAVGPLTNIARALSIDPTFADRVPRLVIMGGSSNEGNVGPYTEFNIAVDPEAAAIVFDSALPVTMAGLNLTRQVSMGLDEIARLESAKTPTALAAAAGLDFYSDFSLKHYGKKSSAMHDPCAVLEVVRPDLFGRSPMRVDVEVTGTHTRGMTVCDHRANAQPPNTDVLVSAERDAVVDLIVAAAISPVIAE